MQTGRNPLQQGQIGFPKTSFKAPGQISPNRDKPGKLTRMNTLPLTPHLSKVSSCSSSAIEKQRRENTTLCPIVAINVIVSVMVCWFWFFCSSRFFDADQLIHSFLKGCTSHSVKADFVIRLLGIELLLVYLPTIWIFITPRFCSALLVGFPWVFPVDVHIGIYGEYFYLLGFYLLWIYQ